VNINWKKELFRTWVVITTFWALAAGGFWSVVIYDDLTSAGELLLIVLIIFLPPLALFIIGIFILWALSGFEQKIMPNNHI